MPDAVVARSFHCVKLYEMRALSLPDAMVGRGRERRQIEAWFFNLAHDTLGELGLGGGWWCAINMPRRDLFDDSSSGDVDILAGPLAYDLTSDEWSERLRSASRINGPALAEANAHAQAGWGGHVAWPPSIRYTVAIEVKASYYSDRWKATHQDRAQQVLGALRQRQRYGINRVAFLHLGSLTSSNDVDAMDARSAIAGWPQLICDPEEFGDFGYGSAVMSNVASNGEPTWGALRGIVWHSRPQLVNEVKRTKWHAALERRFATMPRPRTVCTYVHKCPYCDDWMHAGSASPDGFACERCAVTHGASTWTAHRRDAASG